MLTLIAAQDLAGAIGHANTIPWHVPEDFAFFKRETMGGAVIMGRKTWDSLPRKPLPGRLNVVATRGATTIPDATVVSDLDFAVTLASEAGYDRLYCIGGAQIYQQMLPKADRIFLSTIHLRVPKADAYFPTIDPADWTIVGSTVLRESGPLCKLTEYRRVKLGQSI